MAEIIMTNKDLLQKGLGSDEKVKWSESDPKIVNNNISKSLEFEVGRKYNQNLDSDMNPTSLNGTYKNYKAKSSNYIGTETSNKHDNSNKKSRKRTSYLSNSRSKNSSLFKETNSPFRRNSYMKSVDNVEIQHNSTPNSSMAITSSSVTSHQNGSIEYLNFPQLHEECEYELFKYVLQPQNSLCDEKPQISNSNVSNAISTDNNGLSLNSASSDLYHHTYNDEFIYGLSNGTFVDYEVCNTNSREDSPENKYMQYSPNDGGISSWNLKSNERETLIKSNSCSPTSKFNNIRDSKRSGPTSRDIDGSPSKYKKYSINCQNDNYLTRDDRNNYNDSIDSFSSFQNPSNSQYRSASNEMSFEFPIKSPNSFQQHPHAHYNHMKNDELVIDQECSNQIYLNRMNSSDPFFDFQMDSYRIRNEQSTIQSSKKQLLKNTSKSTPSSPSISDSSKINDKIDVITPSTDNHSESGQNTSNGSTKLNSDDETLSNLNGRSKTLLPYAHKPQTINNNNDSNSSSSITTLNRKNPKNALINSTTTTTTTATKSINSETNSMLLNMMPSDCNAMPMTISNASGQIYYIDSNYDPTNLTSSHNNASFHMNNSSNTPNQQLHTDFVSKIANNETNDASGEIPMTFSKGYSPTSQIIPNINQNKYNNDINSYNSNNNNDKTFYSNSNNLRRSVIGAEKDLSSKILINENYVSGEHQSNKTSGLINHKNMHINGENKKSTNNTSLISSTGRNDDISQHIASNLQLDYNNREINIKNKTIKNSPTTSNMLSEEYRKIQRRENNRIAAAKCRQKKNNTISSLRDMNEKLRQINHQMSTTMANQMAKLNYLLELLRTKCQCEFVRNNVQIQEMIGELLSLESGSSLDKQQPHYPTHILQNHLQICRTNNLDTDHQYVHHHQQQQQQQKLNPNHHHNNNVITNNNMHYSDDNSQNLQEHQDKLTLFVSNDNRNIETSKLCHLSNDRDNTNLVIDLNEQQHCVIVGCGSQHSSRNNDTNIYINSGSTERPDYRPMNTKDYLDDQNSTEKQGVETEMACDVSEGTKSQNQRNTIANSSSLMGCIESSENTLITQSSPPSTIININANINDKSPNSSELRDDVENIWNNPKKIKINNDNDNDEICEIDLIEHPKNLSSGRKIDKNKPNDKSYSNLNNVNMSLSSNLSIKDSDSKGSLFNVINFEDGQKSNVCHLNDIHTNDLQYANGNDNDNINEYTNINCGKLTNNYNGNDKLFVGCATDQSNTDKCEFNKNLNNDLISDQINNRIDDNQLEYLESSIALSNMPIGKNIAHDKNEVNIDTMK